MRSVEPWEVVVTLNCGNSIAFSHAHRILTETNWLSGVDECLGNSLGFAAPAVQGWKAESGRRRLERPQGLRPFKMYKPVSGISGTYVHSSMIFPSCL